MQVENPKSIICGIIKYFSAAFNAFQIISGNYFLFSCPPALNTETLPFLSPNSYYLDICRCSLMGGQFVCWRPCILPVSHYEKITTQSSLHTVQPR